MTAQQTVNEGNRVIEFLVGKGLADDQNYLYRYNRRDCDEVTFSFSGRISMSMKSRYYSDIYDEMLASRLFVACLADGALLQMNYMFVNDEISSHRLAYFPSPYLQRFQDDPDVYMEEPLFADILSKSVVPFPVRFDFDVSNSRHVLVSHPKSHLTLGQYEHCRIPVSAPLSPLHFGHFVLRNFYSSLEIDSSSGLNRPSCSFPDTIATAERELLHVVVPNTDTSTL